MKTKAKWMQRGSFDCLTGEWSGTPFDISAEVVEGVTQYAAYHDRRAVIRNDVRVDNTERRLVITLQGD